MINSVGNMGFFRGGKEWVAPQGQGKIPGFEL